MTDMQFIGTKEERQRGIKVIVDAIREHIGSK